MPADWSIAHWPHCTRYVFLSHCQEDRERLVLPVYDKLQETDCRAWIDTHHYPAGRDGFEVLREKILACRHVVYFVTGNFLRQGRGWTGIERAYARLLQQNLHLSPNDICHVELPLYFLPRDHAWLARSAWGATAGTGRGTYYHSGRVDDGAVEWAVRQILRFVYQEQDYALEVASRASRDASLRDWCERDPVLQDRIFAISPPPLEPPWPYEAAEGG